MGKIESAVSRVLRKFINPIPLSMEEVCTYFEIDLYFSNMKRYDAFYMTRGGRRIIVVKDSLIRSRQRFSIAHELGHAYLGHGPFNFSSVGSRPLWQEVEANRFAAELLMPANALSERLLPSERTPEQISRLCDVSLQAARVRVEALGWDRAKVNRPQVAQLAG